MASPDHDIDVDELDSAAIAAAMGFSSFGAQAHPNKKRRFNPLADAVVGTPRDSRPPAAAPSSSRTAPTMPATTTTTALPPRPTSNLPLHPPHGAPTASSRPKANADEIDLNADDDSEGDDGDGGNGGDWGENNAGKRTALAAAEGEGEGADEEPGPQYLDTSRPVGEIRDHGLGDAEDEEPEDPAALQARIDAVVAAGNAAYGAAAAAAHAGGLPPRPQQLDGSALSAGRDLHAKFRLKDRHGFRADLMPGADRGPSSFASGGSELAESEDGTSEFGGSTWAGAQGGRGQGGRGPGRGQRDWWTGYYDPSSNENPWARVEAKLGLPARGSWLDRGHGRGSTRGQGHGRPPSAPHPDAAVDALG